MQIQVGKGPWASEVAGIVKIGQTMTMVLAIKDEGLYFYHLISMKFIRIHIQFLKIPQKTNSTCSYETVSLTMAKGRQSNWWMETAVS